MAKYKTTVGLLGPLRPLPTETDPLREHRAIIRAIFRLYPDAELRLFGVANVNEREVLTELDPMPTWTR